MNPAFALLVPVALLAVPSAMVANGALPTALSGMPGASPAAMPAPRAERPYSRMPDEFRVPDAQQVRIEQQITIRISPRPMPAPMMPSRFVSEEIDAASGGSHWEERKFGKCMAIAGIAGVQPGPSNRLIMILRDNRVVAASLEKACNSRDFYSGFLVARNADGQLCQGRDELLSRSGSNCKVSGFKQLVQVDD